MELAIGTVCPAFELADVLSGRAVGRDDAFTAIGDADMNRGLLVAFLSVHCPFVQHMESAFTVLTREFGGAIATVAICSNDVQAFPEDGPEHMREQAERLGWRFPYLFDESQEVAREFHAACTPDLYLFDANLRLVYHAQFDETRPYRSSDAAAGVAKHDRVHQPAHGEDLRRAIGAVLAGEAPLQPQRPSLGCNIKWRA